MPSPMSPTIGKVLGVDVQLHWTFILLILFSLIYLPLFILMVFLFGSVFIHELAHVITAKNNGIKPKRVILFPLGGATVMNLDEIEPRAGLRIAVSGPLMSLFLGMLSAVLIVYSPLGLITLSLQLLFVINIILGVGNLLPAFPLDGGRVLKDYIERKRSPLKATEIAVSVSKVLMILFVIGTAVWVFTLNQTLLYKEFVILIDLFIAIYIYGGAKAELQMANVIEYTSKLKVRDAVNRSFIKVKPTTTLDRLYHALLRVKTHIVLYQIGDKVFLVSRYLDESKKRNAPLEEKPVADYGVEIPVMGYNEKLSRAVEEMEMNETGIIAVKKNKKLAGVLLQQHIDSLVALHMQQSNIKKRLGGAH